MNHEEDNEEMNPLIQGIEMSLRAGEKKHNEFVKRHLQQTNGSMDGFYKVYCFENDFEENKRVEEYWKSINRNVNNLYEFKHLTALKIRGRDEVIEILRKEAVTDIFIESNLLDRQQVIELMGLSKSIFYDYLGTYLKSITFISSHEDLLMNDIKTILRGRDEEKYFDLLCSKIEVKFVSHFDKSTEIVMKSKLKPQ